MAIYSRSSIQNINNRSFWIRKDKCIIKFNKQSAKYKIYLYAKDPYEAKYQYLINKPEKVGLKHFDDPKAFIEYPNDMQDVYKNIKEYSLGKKKYKIS